MTSYPQDSNLDYSAPNPRKRPVGVTVASIIVIIFSALGLLSPCAAIPLFIEMPEPVDPAIQAMKNDPLVFTWTLINSGLGFVLAVLGLIGAIGALLMRRWGRSLLLFYAALTLIAAIAGWILQFTVLAGKIPAPTDQTQQMIQFIAQIVGVIIGLGVPLMVLLIFTRKSVKEAFDSAI